LRSVELQYGSTNDDLNVKDVFFYNYSIHQLIIQPEKKKSIEIDWFILYIYACLRFLPKKRKKKKKITAVIHGFSSARNLAVKHLDRPLQMQHA